MGNLRDAVDDDGAAGTSGVSGYAGKDHAGSWKAEARLATIRMTEEIPRGGTSCWMLYVHAQNCLFGQEMPMLTLGCSLILLVPGSCERGIA